MQTIIIQSFFKMSTLLNRVGNMTFQHITEIPLWHTYEFGVIFRQKVYIDLDFSFWIF